MADDSGMVASEDGESLVPASPWRASSWVIVCANGAEHRDYGVGKVSVAAYEQAALDAAAFMDDERENSPWTCGPHTVREAR